MIGVFDSGSGGLSVLKALRACAPNANVVYFGDIAHAPYGVRSSEELAHLTEAGVRVLKDSGATEIVSACNSVSPSFLAGTAGDMPVIEMTKPTALGMQAYKGERVLLIATPATVNSRIYEHALADIVKLESLAIPELAGAIEFGAPDSEVRAIVHTALERRKGKEYGYVLLGCTHYPLALPIVEREAKNIFPNIQCIDPAYFVAEEVTKSFDYNGRGNLLFKISKDSKPFRVRVYELFSEDEYTIEVI